MLKPTKIVMLGYDDRITNTAGSAFPEDVEAILLYAHLAATQPRDGEQGDLEEVVIAHGKLQTDRYKVAEADARHLAWMVWEADKRAHRQAREESR
jgi:hypothetical protein